MLFDHLDSEVQTNENFWCCATGNICQFGNFCLGVSVLRLLLLSGFVSAAYY